FSRKQVTSIKTAIGDVLANVSKSEEPKLEGEDGGKSMEMSKLEDIEILVKEANDKVKIELGEVKGRILKAFNETIVDRLTADGKGCIEARGLTGGDDTGRSGGDDTEHTGGDDTEHTGGDDTEHSGDDSEEH
ncbi:GSCOCG00013621001-RA-CDS, partial [Cotesia congregata]